MRRKFNFKRSRAACGVASLGQSRAVVAHGFGFGETREAMAQKPLGMELQRQVCLCVFKARVVYTGRPVSNSSNNNKESIP